jgi:hypothetical protein
MIFESSVKTHPWKIKMSNMETEWRVYNRRYPGLLVGSLDDTPDCDLDSLDVLWVFIRPTLKSDRFYWLYFKTEEAAIKYLTAVGRL